MHLSWNDSVLSARSAAAALDAQTESLLSRLSVQVESFSVSEVSPEPAPCPSADHQFTVLYVLKGEGSLMWCDGEITLAPGMIALIPGQLPTLLRGKSSDETASDVVPPEAAATDQTASALGDLVVATSVVAASAGHGLGYFESLQQPLVDEAQDVLLGTIFSGILAEMITPGIGSKCIVESLMKQVLIIMLRRTLLNQQNATPLYLTIANPSLALVINKIQLSHAQRLSISSLASIAGMTPLALTSEFERVFGEGLLDYIQGVRLHEANGLLTQTDLPIKAIAASVGFASRSHFSRAFRKQRGQDPTAFRKSALSEQMEPRAVSLVTG